ncbi:hypothetical protein L6164_002892 [Bauhinia variegata]|uniref:Uncharacterized protein n=1 Tax=Bauhinia variegata TaxID=167791 RepID=A0ACB9Q136_BAUVA|nr:hypothetical protein L6164_002892 [Bauhinia variegata]
MAKPQRASKMGDWESFKRFFQEDSRALLEPFDLTGNTALHITAIKNPQLFSELLEMLSPRDQWHALRRKNYRRSTILHNLHLSVEVAKVVLRYGKELPHPPENQIDQQELPEKDLKLLDIRNIYGETPFYRAALCGNLTLLKHLAKEVTDLKTHFHRKDKFSVVHAAVSAQYFDLVPDDGCYDDHTDGHSRRDIETGENNIKQDISKWDGIKHIWKTKKQNKLAEQLADFLLTKDDSWLNSSDHKGRPTIISPAIHRSNVSKFEKEIEPNKNKQYTNQTTGTFSGYTPLLLAAASGIVEIVERYIDLYPEAINHVSEDELNILHVAVMFRQKEIYRIVIETGEWKLLRFRLSSNGHTLLHQVGSMAFYTGNHKAGIAYQLQEELRWYQRVEMILPKNLVTQCNDDNLTAQDLFLKEHESMLIEARNWIKDTAQSCSTVAVLIATVVYAAAYSTPGGTDEKGLPKFLGSSNFLFFTIMDSVALGSSLASVVMFISILTSPFEIKDFYRSLLRKLSLGFTLLLLSLITTMLAFSATILLTMKEKRNWILPLIYSAAALFPVAVFISFQHLFYAVIKDIWKELILRKTLNVIPNSFKRSRDGGGRDVAAKSGGSGASLGDCCWVPTADDELSGGTKGRLGIRSGGRIQVTLESDGGQEEGAER